VHKISIVLFPNSLIAERTGEVLKPCFRAEIVTHEDESVHDRIARFQKDTDNCRMQIAQVTDLSLAERA
jgi:hypothetical protein